MSDIPTKKALRNKNFTVVLSRLFIQHQFQCHFTAALHFYFFTFFFLPPPILYRTPFYLPIILCSMNLAILNVNQKRREKAFLLSFFLCFILSLFLSFCLLFCEGTTQMDSMDSINSNKLVRLSSPEKRKH